MTLEQLSSHALTARLGELLATERRTLVEFVLHLAEVERRRLHLEMGFSSLFAFCTAHLKLSNASAYRRTVAVQLVTRFPVIGEYLRDGRLSLTTLALLRDVLDEESSRQILERAAGKTEEEVKRLVAALRPQEAPPDLFRRLPAPPAPPAPSASACAPSAAAAQPGVTSELEVPISASLVPPRRTPARPTLQPISEELHVLRITVDRAFVDDLERARALLSHSIPDRDLVRVIHECVRRTIVAAEKRRRGSERPRARPAAGREAGAGTRFAVEVKADAGRGIAVEVKREVWRRDGGACAFVAANGRRCSETHQVEFHHLVPFARGGLSTVENLSLRCRMHNHYAAELDYGRELIGAARGPARSAPAG